jgi:hypothetical protein
MNIRKQSFRDGIGSGSIHGFGPWLDPDARSKRAGSRASSQQCYCSFRPERRGGHRARMTACNPAEGSAKVKRKCDLLASTSGNDPRKRQRYGARLVHRLGRRIKSLEMSLTVLPQKGGGRRELASSQDGRPGCRERQGRGLIRVEHDSATDQPFLQAVKLAGARGYLNEGLVLAVYSGHFS